MPNVMRTGGGGRAKGGKVEYSVWAKPVNLDVGRYGHVSIADAAGNVYVAGGGTAIGVATNSIEKYSQSGKSASLTLSVARRYLAATSNPLPGGGVYIGGGESGDGRTYYATVDFIQADGTKGANLAMSDAKRDLAATTDGNGVVYFGGGFGKAGMSAVVDKFSGTSKTSATPLNVARMQLAAATDGVGNVLFAGGNTGAARSAVVEKYPMSGAKVNMTGLSVARSKLAAATDGAGNVWFAGGELNSVQSAVDKYTPDGVRTTYTLSVARSKLAAATDGAGNVLFAGGTTIGSEADAIDVIDVFTHGGIKTAGVPLSAARCDFAATTDGAGNVLFAGGRLGSTTYSTVDAYVAGGERVPDTVALNIRKGDKYKFEEHTSEQTATGTAIVVSRPNSGYIKYQGEVSL